MTDRRHFQTGLILPPAAPMTTEREPHTLMERVAALERSRDAISTKMAALQGILAARDHGFTNATDFAEQLEAWAWSVYVEEKQ